jgi:hypothetical protein
MQRGRRLVTAALWILVAVGCSGPTSPSDSSSGTIVFDGQTFNGTLSGSGAGSRAPALNWVDISIGDCSPTGIAMTLKEVDNRVICS